MHRMPKEPSRGHPVPWNWSYKWRVVSCCVGAGSSLRATQALHYWVISQGPSYLIIMPHHGLVAPNIYWKHALLHVLPKPFAQFLHCVWTISTGQASLILESKLQNILSTEVIPRVQNSWPRGQVMVKMQTNLIRILYKVTFRLCTMYAWNITGFHM